MHTLEEKNPGSLENVVSCGTGAGSTVMNRTEKEDKRRRKTEDHDKLFTQLDEEFSRFSFYAVNHTRRATEYVRRLALHPALTCRGAYTSSLPCQPYVVSKLNCRVHEGTRQIDRRWNYRR